MMIASLPANNYSQPPLISGDGDAYLTRQKQILQKKMAEEEACQSTDEQTKKKTVAELQQKLDAVEGKISKKVATDAPLPDKIFDRAPPAATSQRLFDVLV